MPELRHGVLDSKPIRLQSTLKKRDNMWTQTTGLVKQVVERILVIHAGHGLAETRQVARV